MLHKIDLLKQELDGLRPIPEDLLSELRRYYRIGLTYANNALEGNTLTESETKVVLEDGITVNGKPLRDHMEALGHAEAYDRLFELTDKMAWTEADLLGLHRLLLGHERPADAGRYRERQVMITGADFVPPKASALAGEMQHFIGTFYPEWKRSLHPIHTAAKTHLELVRIHPFVDGNGRVARLLMNLVLFQAGYPITVIPPILRTEYIIALKTATRLDAPSDEPFLTFIEEVVYESFKDYLRLLRHLLP